MVLTLSYSSEKTNILGAKQALLRLGAI